VLFQGGECFLRGCFVLNFDGKFHLEGSKGIVIDWFNLAANSLWILGCAIALATISYASWAASQQQVKLRQQLRGTGYQAALNSAGLLFCLGLAGLSARWWETVLWLALSAWFILQIGLPFILSRFRT
jgi:hypothetical protein